MKKRILALALAGTTAFSVFSMAVSAGTSTSVWYGFDQYVPYEAADLVEVELTTTTEGTAGLYTIKGTNWNHANAEFLMSQAANIQENYVRYYSIPAVIHVAAEDNWAFGEALLDAGKITYTPDGVGTLDYYCSLTGDYYANVEDAADAVLASKTIGAYVEYKWTGNASAVSSEYIPAADWAKLPTYNEYYAANVIYGVKETVTGTVEVDTEATGWKFNGTIDDVMDTPVAAGTVYAYDFYYTNDWEESAGTIATLWAKYGQNTETALALGKGTYPAEDGLGKYFKGIRYDVIGEWVAFLNELAINDDGVNYFESEKDFVANYVDMYYGDPVYSQHTGKLLGYNYIDLYNIDELLHNIYELNTAAAYSQANTSELVYLMQQYNKYIGEYIEVEAAETTEWGAMMLEVLEAADEANFKSARAYKNYVLDVEDLADAYENATTPAMIREAELGMYEMLINPAYRAVAAADTTAIAGTAASMFFNELAAPAIYDGSLAPVFADTYFFANLGVIELYPEADYTSTTNDVTSFNGNTAKYGYKATAEYEWMVNVYELAMKVAANNDYQGSVDAMAEVLADAVAALEVNTAPKASAVMAMEEEVAAYAGKIDTDYKAAWYGLYVEANAYAEVAEGKKQVADATDMVVAAGSQLSLQLTQNTVTKNDIKALEAAIADAEDAIDAIKNSDEYNAAQVTALNKAIATAEGILEVYAGSAYTADPYGLFQSVNDQYTNYVGDKDQIVLSTVDNAIAAIESAINYSTVIEGWSKNADGAWQYGEDGAYVEDGWKKIDGLWYYFEDGAAAQSTWKKLDGKWYYLNKNCAAAYGWCKVDGEWYYFDGDCSMAEGWRKVDGNWYYLTPNEVGKMVTGEQTIDGVKYNFSTESNSLGQML